MSDIQVLCSYTIRRLGPYGVGTINLKSVLNLKVYFETLKVGLIGFRILEIQIMNGMLSKSKMSTNLLLCDFISLQ